MSRHEPAKSAPSDDTAAVEDLRQTAIEGSSDVDLGDVHAGSSRLRAWKVCAAARSDRLADARTRADAIDKKDPWSTLARGCLLRAEHSRDALAKSARGMKALAGHEDIVWIRAWVLADNAQVDALRELHRSSRSRLRDPLAAELDLALADGLAAQDWVEKTGALTEALQLAADVRARLPEHVRAHTLAVRWLLRVGRAGEARPLAERAAAIAPTNARVRRQRWEVLLADPALDAAQKVATIRPEVQAVLERDDDPRVLYEAAEVLGQLGLFDEREAVWVRIEREHKDSETAGYVAWDRIDLLQAEISRQKGMQGKADPRLALQLKERLHGATDHAPAMWRGRAHVHLFMVLQAEGDGVDPAELLGAVEGMVKHEKLNPHIVYAIGPRALAQRTPHVERALEIVELGLADAERRTDDPPEARTFLRVELLVAKAAVLVRAGRLDEAERVLDAAAAVAGADVRIHAARGEIDEARGDVAAARAHYLEGLPLEANAFQRPCSEALERLWTAEHGNRRGFERHMARMQASARATRKAKILAARIDEERSLPPFDLRSVQGRSLTSDALRDKVAVVHFWATWCGWCVAEMKAIGELEAKYARVADVEIVLVSGDTNPDQLQRWLGEHGFTFDTLLGEAYAHTAGIRSWPTTLFLDRAGRIRYEHGGATSDLVAEFSWRIEALRRRARPGR